MTLVLGTGHLFAANGIAGKEKSLNVDDSPVGKLLMYNSNRFGPRTEPWGTPVYRSRHRSGTTDNNRLIPVSKVQGNSQSRR